MTTLRQKPFRDIGGPVGHYPTGPLNAVTDVAGVTVGHVTLIEGERTRTGAARRSATAPATMRSPFRRLKV